MKLMMASAVFLLSALESSTKNSAVEMMASRVSRTASAARHWQDHLVVVRLLSSLICNPRPKSCALSRYNSDCISRKLVVGNGGQKELVDCTKVVEMGRCLATEVRYCNNY